MMLERILKRVAQVLTFITIGLGIFFTLGSQKIENAPNAIKYRYDEVKSPFDNKIYALKIPDQMDFAGEPVPLTDDDIRQRIDKELLVNMYWHSQTLYIMKQFNQVIKIIEPILEKNGVPHDFVYLCVAESGLQYNATSPSGAVGLWQFMKPTGQKYRLLINGEVDERMNYEKSTEAACKYFLEAKEKFGSWTMAAASFNMGIDGLANTSRAQDSNNYYDLYLNRETGRYVYRILALKEVLSNPRKYGFFLESDDLYAPYTYRTIAVDSSINNLTAFAKEQGTNYKMLRLMNPWMIGYSLTNKDGKRYDIKIPESD
ncbi:MAG: lytic transglycosylase domain-containing protein [Chitinophagales bacterium]